VVLPGTKPLAATTPLKVVLPPVLVVVLPGGVMIGKKPLFPSLPPPHAASTQAATVVNDESKTRFSKIIIFIRGS
jgi:hypothetical protein